MKSILYFSYFKKFALGLLLTIGGISASYAGGCGIDVTTSCSPSAGGKITSSSCTYTAVPNTGYVFSYWRISGETGNGSISAKTKTDNPYTIEDSYAAIIGMYGGELTLTAYFTTVTTYTITWKNWDGTTLKTTTVNANATPSYSGSTPTRAATAQYTYTFKGWSPTIVAATANATYTAQYTSTVRKYAIKFVNYDGTVLQNTQVAYGSTPSYTGSTPTKASDAQYTYTFKGWSPSVSSVTGTATYTAQYTSTVRKYAIKFVNYDGTVLQNTQVAYGSTPEYKGATPAKPATPKYTYTFKGWSPNIVAVKGGAIYTAQYDSTLIEYEIHVTPEGGTTEGGTVTIDGDPNYGETVTLTPVPDEGYVFEGWSDGNTDNPRDIVVGGDSTIYPIFIKKQYLIQFVNYDESVLQSGNVEHGVKPSYTGTTPVKPASKKYTYTFKGWNAEIVVATEPATYIAQYDSTLIEYEIHVTPEGGNTEGGTVTIDGDTNYGETVTLTPVPDEGYVFEQWSDGNTDNPRDIVVGGDSTIYPIFHKCEEIITLTEIVIGKGESYEFGGKLYSTRGIYYDTITLATGCDSISTLKLSVIKKKTFNLRVVVDSTQLAWGTAIGSGIYNDGQTVTIEAIPASSKYVFARWWNPDGGIEIFENPYTFTLTRNLTVKAVFKRAPKRIVVKQQGASHAMSHVETDIVAVIEVGERTATVNNTSESTYRIYDSAGHLVITSAEDNTYALPSGLYFIHIDGESEKFIIQ